MEGEVIGKYKVGEWFFVSVENVFGFDETDGQVGES